MRSGEQTEYDNKRLMFPDDVLGCSRYDQRGFIFYTNYNSRKGQELIGTKHAAFSVYWEKMQRQVNILMQLTALDVESSMACPD